MKTLLCLAGCIMLLFSACKKVKPVIYEGQLLLTQKYPYPVANRAIGIDQGSSNGSSASSATTTTDVNGYFRISFTPGKSDFLFLGGTNGSPLDFGTPYGDTTFPVFLRSNFPDSTYAANKSFYIGKVIDTTVIKVLLSTDLVTTDTIGLHGYTLSGTIEWDYSGRSGTKGDTIVLDTIYNLLFTEYEGYTNSFRNTVYAGIRVPLFGGTGTLIHSIGVVPDMLSATDETKQEFTFFISK